MNDRDLISPLTQATIGDVMEDRLPTRQIVEVPEREPGLFHRHGRDREETTLPAEELRRVGIGKGGPPASPPDAREQRCAVEDPCHGLCAKAVDVTSHLTGGVDPSQQRRLPRRALWETIH